VLFLTTRALFLLSSFARRREKPKTNVFCLSRHGYFDLPAYEKYVNGELTGLENPDINVQESLAKLPLSDSYSISY
jgi:tryptophan synthase beta chain